jgi:hypothetical protein
MVDEQTIDQYAKTVGKDYDTVFGEIAGWATGFVADVAADDWDAKRNFVDTQSGSRGGMPFGLVADIAKGDAWDAKRNFVDTQPASRAGAPTDADFCFVTDIADGDDWDAKRNFVDIQPIASALDAIAPKPGRAIPHVDLESFISRDMA